MISVLPNAQQIEDLFQIPVSVSVKPLGDQLHTLTPRELAVTDNMGEKRLFDYSTGRACAHEALASLACRSANGCMESTKVDLLSDESRQPLWPPGIVGSISHCEPLALAVVSEKHHCVSLGVDIEPLATLESDVVDLICTEIEKSRLPATVDQQARCEAACLLFSIKESIFKCLYPPFRHWFDFQQASVTLDRASGCYSVEFADDLPFTELVKGGFYGNFALLPRHVASSAVLLHDTT